MTRGVERQYIVNNLVECNQQSTVGQRKERSFPETVGRDDYKIKNFINQILKAESIETEMEEGILGGKNPMRKSTDGGEEKKTTIDPKKEKKEKEHRTASQSDRDNCTAIQCWKGHLELDLYAKLRSEGL